MALATTNTVVITLAAAAGTVTIKRFGDGSFTINDKDGKTTRWYDGEASGLKTLLDSFNSNVTMVGSV